MTVRRLLSAAVVAATSLFGLPGTAGATTYVNDSIVWTGYSSNGAPGSHWYVQAEVRVPHFSCVHSNDFEGISPWVGIGGQANPHVEQIGWNQLCWRGHPYIHTWYETYPKPSVVFNLPGGLHQGDLLFLSVQYQGYGNLFGFSMYDQTTGTSFTTVAQAPPGYHLSSGECIAETGPGTPVPRLASNLTWSTCNTGPGGFSAGTTIKNVLFNPSIPRPLSSCALDGTYSFACFIIPGAST